MILTYCFHHPNGTPVDEKNEIKRNSQTKLQDKNFYQKQSETISFTISLSRKI